MPRDYDELSKIFPNSKPHFTAAMPEDPDRVDNYGKYFSKRVKSNKILLGNSATRENCHFEVMELLEHLKDENLEIICPLAYGDRSYAMSVEEEGMRIFGSKFKAILDYQDFDSYKNMIAGCSVGIFANNRQQAMGNIAMMIMMGRKVYLREGTSMWYSYLDYGIKMYPISELNKITYSELMDYNESIAMENDKKIRKRYNDYVRNWSAIFNI
ncbi:TDP-N-acetylfucosamine:lipid II N-acetylfucosaminyltransferase [Candidatus Saccharibacteria bacterium]|nr:TDP-N-acetylfucosamine:lipid II N-acetylfucosaminyltransferase [Candidatus Saccharibacteria bacterium]